MSDEYRVFGFDPSLRGFGISDGDRHHVISTGSDQALHDRVDALVEDIDAFMYGPSHPMNWPKQMWCIEAPMLAQTPHGGSHLYEIGHVMRAITSELADSVREAGVELVVLEVAIGTLRHFTVGLGNAPKDMLAYMVREIYGVTFERDRGCDKLVAWSLVQYGRAVLARTTTHNFIAPRGQGRDERANQRAAARTRKANVA